MTRFGGGRSDQFEYVIWPEPSFQWVDVNSTTQNHPPYYFQGASVSRKLANQTAYTVHYSGYLKLYYTINEIKVHYNEKWIRPQTNSNPFYQPLSTLFTNDYRYLSSREKSFHSHWWSQNWISVKDGEPVAENYLSCFTDNHTSYFTFLSSHT